MIPTRFTCSGENLSPELTWSGVPGKTKSLALICDDPDAPVGTWIHWVIFNIPPGEKGLSQGISSAAKELTNGAKQGMNSFYRIGYGGPCPPKGPAHRYFFKLYALDSVLDLKPGSIKQALLSAMKDHVLAETKLMGRYRR